jgi:hypothetical protein
LSLDGSPGSPANSRKTTVARSIASGNAAARPSRLSSSLTRLAQGTANQAPASPHPVSVSDFAASPGSESNASGERPQTAPARSNAAANERPASETSTELERWLALWEEREELIAYRLALIDGQFEALIRKRELEGAVSPPPTVPQLVATLTQLFPEV